MSVNLSPIGNDAPFVDASGNPLSGGLLYTYVGGSVSTAQTTYTTSSGNVANANPIVLDSGGYPSSSGNVVSIWLTAGATYKFVLKTSAGATVWSRDNISGINDTTVTLNEWVAGPAPTYIGATQFSLVGDQTSTFQVGRRIKSTNSGGTAYSIITVCAYAVVTTVTVVNDSTALDAGMSAVYYGFLSASNPSIPIMGRLTNSLSGDVSIAVQNTEYTGPTVAQGTAGIWMVYGSVTVTDAAAGGGYLVRLWDGTTVIDSAVVGALGAGVFASIHLSGSISAPAGNLKISVKNNSAGLTTSKILFNQSGYSKDSTITAIRIA